MAKVTPVAQAFCDSEGRNDAAFDALTGFSGYFRGPSIFSAGLVEVCGEAIPFGENRLQEGMEPFRAGHRFLQLREKLAGVHIS